jgi:hypothetical protein
MVGVQSIGWKEHTPKLNGPRLGGVCTLEVRVRTGPDGEPVMLHRGYVLEGGMGGRR